MAKTKEVWCELGRTVTVDFQSVKVMVGEKRDLEPGEDREVAAAQLANDVAARLHSYVQALSTKPPGS